MYIDNIEMKKKNNNFDKSKFIVDLQLERESR